MIRRLRVGLKHSNPTYAQESSSGLMPSLLGVPTNRYRLFVLLICLFFIYTWNSQNTSFEEALRRKDEQNEVLRRDRDSIAEKLRVIWLHKKKLEATLETHKSDSEKLLSRMKLKDSEVYGWKTKNENCLKELSDCKKTEGNKTKINETNKRKDEQNVEEWKKKVEDLEEKLKKKEMENNVESGILKEELKQCETKIKQLTGGGAVEHYSQNETAHFKRNHKADEPLSFDRGNIQHHIPNKLLLGKQLAETLEEARLRKLHEKEQLEKHPEDRDDKDQEVNEQPDKDEQDYKEH